MQLETLPQNLFKSGVLPEEEFGFSANRVEFAEKVYVDVWIKVTYRSDGSLTFRLQTDMTDFDWFQCIDTDATISGAPLREPLSLFSIGIENGEVELIPRRQPVVITASNDAAYVRAVLLNGPKISQANSTFDDESDFFEFEGFNTTKVTSENVQAQKVPTALVTLKNTAARLDADDATKSLNKLMHFLSFACGARVGLGNVIGYNERNEVVFAIFGFWPSDHLTPRSTWADFDFSYVNLAYRHFGSYWHSEQDNKVVARAISFYRSSNVSREASDEIALVASYAALETLVYYILSTRSGWSNSLLNKRTIAFHEKLRAVASTIELRSSLFCHSETLKRRAKKLGDADEFEAFCWIRNKVTHYSKDVQFDAFEVHEAWRVSQWLCELMIFHLIGFQDQMCDRRRTGGWSVGPEAVPLKSGIA